MTHNARPHLPEYPLLMAVTEPKGTSVDKELFVKLADLLEGEKPHQNDLPLLRDPDDEHFLCAWAMEFSSVEAFEYEGAFYVTAGSLKRSEGATEKTAELLKDWSLDVDGLAEWNFDQDFTLKVALTGYPDAVSALQDAKRLVVRAMLRERELRSVLGWREDAVLLARGHLWITARVRRNGEVNLDYNEEPMWAYQTYQEECSKLAGELMSHELDIDQGDVLPYGKTRGVAAYFIMREAAELMLNQSKLSLTVQLQGVQELSDHFSGGKLKLGTLAENLYTDTATLNRARDRRTR